MAHQLTLTLRCGFLGGGDVSEAPPFVDSGVVESITSMKKTDAQ